MDYFEVKKEVEGIKNHIKKNDKIYIFGAGIIGERVYESLKTSNKEVVAFIDNDEEKQKSSYLNMPVISKKDVDKNIPIVISVSQKYLTQLREEFEDIGYIWLENLFGYVIYQNFLYDIDNDL